MSIALLGPIVVHSFNPLYPKDRVSFRGRAGATLNELRPNRTGAVVCVLNGEPVLAADWDYVPSFDDHVFFAVLPRGGGGGDSNVISVILGIVLIAAGVVSGYNPYLIGAGVGLLAVGLIPTPNAPVALLNQNQLEQSPTYNLQLSGNSARLSQSIPVPYGRHILMPDFAGQPYTEYDSVGDQYYHAVLCLGMIDKFTLEQVLIDDTELAHFEGVQQQLYGPDHPTPLTIVNPCVVNAPEIAQQDLEFGKITGPFAACGPGLKTSKLGIDVLMPKGLFSAESDGSLSPKTIDWMFEARPINDFGAATGSWFLLGLETLTLADSRPVRRTYTYTVPSGRYEVRGQRVSARDSSNRVGHDVQWLSLRSYLDVAAPLDTNATYLALRIKASNQLSGLSQRRISVILRRWLPVWNGSAWTVQETRSIAWALADILRNQVYGGKLDDSRIDLATLLELDSLWADRGDEFNAVFDRRTTVWDALTVVARAGRAKPMMRGSVVTFVRDSYETLPVALFNMRNIKRKSFRLDYAPWVEGSPDGVEVEFFNQRTWAQDYVVMPIPGVAEGDVVNPTRISLVGVTKKSQAQREAAKSAAEMVYRRSFVTFVTEMEGYLPAGGDLIAVAHDVASWGSSGEISKWEAPVATCSEQLNWSVGDNYVVIADQYGDPHGPYRVVPGPKPNSMEFLDDPEPDQAIYDGFEQERTRYSMGPASSFVKYAKILEVSPQEGTEIMITAVIDDSRVHFADLPYEGEAPEDGGIGGGSGSRVFRYGPDDLPNYDAASDEQRNSYGFYADESYFVGSSNDAPYVYLP